MTRRDLAVRLVAIRVLKDRLTQHENSLRAAVREAMVEGDRDVCVVDVGDGGKPLPVGTVGLAKAAESWRVTDTAALLEWVKANRPTEVVSVEQVRPAYVTALLAQVKADGGIADDNGELVEVPGVECRTGEPTLQVKPNHDAARLVETAWNAGTLTMADLLAVEPVPGDMP